jgi:hypothetical protein
MEIIRKYSKEHKNRVKKYDNIIESDSTTQGKRMEASILKRLEMVEMANSYTHTYNVSNILNVALLVKSVNVSIENIEKQLTESGVIEKVKEVENTKTELLKIIKKLKEDLKRIEKSRKNTSDNLNYIS